MHTHVKKVFKLYVSWAWLYATYIIFLKKSKLKRECTWGLHVKSTSTTHQELPKVVTTVWSSGRDPASEPSSLFNWFRVPSHILLTSTGAAEGMPPFPLGHFILLCRPWRSSAASLNDSLKLSLKAREQCPSSQGGVQLSLGWHLQGYTLAQGLDEELCDTSWQTDHSARLFAGGRWGYTQGCSEGISLLQIFCSCEQVTMLDVLFITWTFLFFSFFSFYGHTWSIWKFPGRDQ